MFIECQYQQIKWQIRLPGGQPANSKGKVFVVALLIVIFNNCPMDDKRKVKKLLTRQNRIQEKVILAVMK